MSLKSGLHITKTALAVKISSLLCACGRTVEEAGTAIEEAGWQMFYRNRQPKPQPTNREVIVKHYIDRGGKLPEIVIDE